MDTRKKIKELIEELNYRTDHKSSEEIYQLSRELYELSVLAHRDISPIAPPENTPSETDSEVKPSPMATEPQEDSQVQDLPDSTSVDIDEPSKDDQQEVQNPPDQIAQPQDGDLENEPEEPTPPLPTGPDPVEEERDNSATASQKSLNDVLGKTLNIGFNDRFAFVNKLFDGNQDDYNRVVSQLNTMKSFVEARNFIESIVKPDYNWSESEEYEVRFMEILERHFD